MLHLQVHNRFDEPGLACSYLSQRARQYLVFVPDSSGGMVRPLVVGAVVLYPYNGLPWVAHCQLDAARGRKLIISHILDQGTKSFAKHGGIQKKMGRGVANCQFNSAR